MATGDVQDITTQLLLDGMRWEATTVGEWRIDAYSISGTGFNISDSVSITVLHGEAVTVAADLSTTSPTAGDRVDIQVTGTDADGNQFPQDVEWTEDGASVPTLSIITSSEGTYTYDAEVAGLHTLQYSVGGAVSTAEITVAAQNTVARLQVNLSTDSLEQLASLDVSIRAFDAFDNEIPVPGSVQVESTGRGKAVMTSSDLWTVTTLDDGPQTITVKVGAVIVNEEITVIGNCQGVFVAGGTLYYVVLVCLRSWPSFSWCSVSCSCETAAAATTGTMTTTTMTTTTNALRSNRPCARSNRSCARPNRPRPWSQLVHHPKKPCGGRGGRGGTRNHL